MLVILFVEVHGYSAQENLVPPGTQPLGGDQAVTALVKGNNEFALNMYGEICTARDTDNIFFSPYSISSALAMTWDGARGQTAVDMAETLNFTLSVEETDRAFHSLTEAMSSGNLTGAETGEPFTLSVSNGLWVQDGFNLLEEYINEVTRYYGAGVRNLDFSGDPEGSREIINNWVAESTLNRILNLIPRGLLAEDTRVVLTNAVYFKASWENPFDEHCTSNAPFTLLDGSEIDVPMMNQTNYFKYVSTDGCSAVELDYASGNASMLIILPDEDITEFQRTFDTGMFEAIRRRLSSCNVSLSMPEFEYTRSLQLSQMLRTLGMGSAFDGSADFSGFTGSPGLFISEVLHKAFVKVDESGTEAAAATAVIMRETAMPVEPVTMNINRPFMFFILDKETGSIVFMGRVTNPSEGNS